MKPFKKAHLRALIPLTILGDMPLVPLDKATVIMKVPMEMISLTNLLQAYSIEQTT
jgi:hypothetical protein